MVTGRVGVGGASRGWSLGEWGWVGLAEGGHWASGGGWAVSLQGMQAASHTAAPPTADVTIDVFERCQQGKPLPDLTRYGAFEELYK